jgi:hypothetical protein
MTLRTIYSLAQCQYGKYFLTKSYSVELLLYLLEHRQADGIEDLLLSLKSSTPKFPAFLSYIALLEAKGCITKIENAAKRSKRTIKLTTECEEVVRQHFC